MFPTLDTLRKIFFENKISKLISFLIAILLWGLVLGSRSVEVIKEIPLEVVTGPDVMIASEIPDKVAFRLSGPKAFLRTILDRRDNPIQVNLVNNRPGIVTYRFFSDSIKVPLGIKVVGVQPSALTIRLEQKIEKDVRVRIALRGQPVHGHFVQDIVVNPETVRVAGAASILDGMDEIEMSPIDITGINANTEKPVQFDISKYGLKIISEYPKIQIKVGSQPHVDRR